MNNLARYFEVSTQENKTMKKELVVSMIITTSLYMLCGFLGYATFGKMHLVTYKWDLDSMSHIGWLTFPVHVLWFT